LEETEAEKKERKMPNNTIYWLIPFGKSPGASHGNKVCTF
jgi:hypothetical protein